MKNFFYVFRSFDIRTERFCGKKIAVAKMCDPHSFLESDDLGWGASALGGDLGWAGEATRCAQGCGGGYPLLGLLERDIILDGVLRAGSRMVIGSDPRLSLLNSSRSHA